MKTLLLGGANWHTKDDFYDAVLDAVGAPPWHGRNLDALNDTVRGDDINRVKLPYTIVICGAARMGQDALMVVGRFRELIEEMGIGGEPVAIELQD